MIYIQKEENWEAPEGILPAFLKDIRVMEKMINGNVETIVRPIFQITSLHSPRYNYLVAKSYPLSDPQKFSADFTNWLGDRFYDLADENGKIELKKLESLIGDMADLQVVHIHNDGHKGPFRHLQTIAPAGSLIAQN